MERIVFVFYVPKGHAEIVLDACFAAQAGVIGNYTNCCWSVEGVGQFMPSDQANPAIGSVKKLTKLPEIRVEMLSDLTVWPMVKKAFLAMHPYEEPVYFTFPAGGQ